MSRKKGDGPDLLLIWIGILTAVTLYGPVMALAFKVSITTSALILLPIVGPAVVLGLGILIFKFYWSRY